MAVVQNVAHCCMSRRRFSNKIAAHIGLLDLAADRVRQARLDNLILKRRALAGPRLERGAEAVHRQIVGVPCGARASKTPCWKAACPVWGRGTQTHRRCRRARAACISSRMASARADSGTRCSRCAFMRAAGTVQVLSSKSISFQRAPITSPVRAAVRIKNSSPRAAIASRVRKLARKACNSA